MTVQNSVAVRDAKNDSFEVTSGTAPVLRLYTGAQPANCAAAATGTLAAQGSLPSDWLANSSGGTKSKLGTWTLTGQAAAGAGVTVGYYRIYDTAAANCHEQGSIKVSVVINTSALTAANGNVLNFASTTGVNVGDNVSGTGVPAGATVAAVTATTVTLNVTSTAGVASAAVITFSGDMSIDNSSVANAQVVTVNSYSKTASGA